MPLLLEIVTPERLAYSDEVDAVFCPGIEGELGVLPHHAPLLSTLGHRRAAHPQGCARRSSSPSPAASSRCGRTRSWSWPRLADLSSEIDLEAAEEARNEAERAIQQGFEEPADLARARASMERALLRIRVAERRHREGPRQRP